MVSTLGCTPETWQKILGENTEVPNVAGTWTGRVEAIDVFSRPGRKVYRAAVLHVTNGPSVATTPPAPLLVYGDGPWLRPLDPAKLPVGHMVEVYGKLATAYVTEPKGAEPGGGDIVVREVASTRPASRESILLIKGKPKVLGR